MRKLKVAEKKQREQEVKLMGYQAKLSKKKKKRARKEIKEQRKKLAYPETPIRDHSRAKYKEPLLKATVPRNTMFQSNHRESSFDHLLRSYFFWKK